jgi:hypothetical protein
MKGSGLTGKFAIGKGEDGGEVVGGFEGRGGAKAEDWGKGSSETLELAGVESLIAITSKTT